MPCDEERNKIFSQFDKHIDFNEIYLSLYENASLSNSHEEDQNLFRRPGKDYAKYLLQKGKIDIRYFIRNCNDYYCLSGFTDELLSDALGKKLLIQLTEELANTISEEPELLVPQDIRSEFRNYEIEKYERPLDIFTTSATNYYSMHGDVLSIIRKIYDLDNSLFFSLLEKLKSRTLIQEFVFRDLVRDFPDDTSQLTEMIIRAPDVLELGEKTWNNKISIFVLLSISLEKLISIWLKNNIDPNIENFANQICNALYNRKDRALVIYSFTAYLIQMQYFPNTELPLERQAYNNIAKHLLDNFRINSKLSNSIEEISQYIGSVFLQEDENCILNFKQTGALYEQNNGVSSYYPVLVFLVLSAERNNIVNEEIVSYFERLIMYNDDFYNTIPKNNGDLSYYHFLIASAYAETTNPQQRWLKTRDLINQLICRLHFYLYQKDFNKNLKVVSFCLHIGIALSDILENNKKQPDQNVCFNLCEKIWGDYKNLIITSGDPYLLNFHITVTYMFTFMCIIINDGNEEHLYSLYDKLNDYHAFPGLQLMMLLNLNLNGIDSNHKILKYPPIKNEFDEAINALEKYTALLDLENREDELAFSDRDINVYNEYLEYLMRKNSVTKLD